MIIVSENVKIVNFAPGAHCIDLQSARTKRCVAPNLGEPPQTEERQRRGGARTRENMSEGAYVFDQFAQRLWRGGWGYLWTPDTGEFYKDKTTGELREGKRSIWLPPEREPVIPSGWDGNVYFGVHPSTQARKPWQRSIIKEIAAINCVFAEIDGKDMVNPRDADIAGALEIVRAEALERLKRGKLPRMTPESALHRQAVLLAKETIFKSNVDHYNRLIHAHVMSLSPKPSAIVFSGGGYHLYWLLGDTFYLHTDADRERAKQLQRRWVSFVGGDDGAKDLTRVLRPWDTYNKKTKYAPNYPRVTLVHLDYGTEYSLEQLEALLPTDSHTAYTDSPQSAQKRSTAHRSAPQPTDSHRERSVSIVDAFNDAYSLEQLLPQYGYKKAGDRFVRPGGSSASVQILPNGKALAWSSNDPLFNDEYHAITAFDAYKIWEHNGDFVAALRGAARLLGLELALVDVARRVASHVKEWIVGADFAPYVANEYKAKRRMGDDTYRLEYRSGHTDKLIASLVLDGMIKAGKALGFTTSARRLVATVNSDGIGAAVCGVNTASSALTRLSFMFDVTTERSGITVSLRRDFVERVDCVRSRTSILDSEYIEVRDLTQSTLDYDTYKGDDAFLTGTAKPVRARVKRTAREMADIDGATYPALMEVIPSGLSTFAIPMVTALLEAGGTGCTLDDLRAASGASVSRVRSVLATLSNAGLVESHRQYKAQSIHFIVPDAFDRIKREVAPKLRTYGLGVHRLDKQLEQVQHWAEKEADEAREEGDTDKARMAEYRAQRAAKRREPLLAHLHPDWDDAMIDDQVYASVYSPQRTPQAPEMPPAGDLSWYRLCELTGKNLLTQAEFVELWELNQLLGAGVPFAPDGLAEQLSRRDAWDHNLGVATAKLHEQARYALGVQ